MFSHVHFPTLLSSTILYTRNICSPVRKSVCRCKDDAFRHSVCTYMILSLYYYNVDVTRSCTRSRASSWHSCFAWAEFALFHFIKLLRIIRCKTPLSSSIYPPWCSKVNNEQSKAELWINEMDDTFVLKRFWQVINACWLRISTYSTENGDEYG